MVKGFKKLILLSKVNTNQNPYLIVTPDNIIANRNGGYAEITIQSNIKWIATIK